MARRETVGQAYILMRADGRLLEGDMRRAAQKAAVGSAEEWRDGFSKAMQDEDQALAKRFQTSLAKAAASDDFAAFRKQYGTIGDTVDGVTERLEGLRAQNRITLNDFRRSSAALGRWEKAERARMLKEASQSDRDFREASLRNTARYLTRMQNLYAEANRTGNWSLLSRRTEETSETLERVTNELREYGRAMRMTDDDIRRVADGMAEWAEKTEAANRRAGNALDGYREKFRTDEIDNFTRSLARAQETGDFSRLVESGERAEDAIRRISQRMDGMRDEGLLLDRQVDDLRRSMDAWYNSTGRQNDQLRDMREITEAIRRNDFRLSIRPGETTEQGLRRVVEQLERWNREGRINSEMLSLARRRIQDWGEETARSNSRLGNMVIGLRRGRGAIGVFAEGLGRAFGRGSRNDLLNFVGSVIRNMTLFATALPIRALETLTERLNVFSSTRAASLAGGAGEITAALRGMGAALGGPQGVITLVGALAAGLLVFGKLVPALAALISMIAASVVLLVGSIATGLIGAILALGPVLVGAAGGVGLLIAAFARLGESETAKAAFDKLKNSIIEIADQLVPKLERLISTLTPRLSGLFESLGRSVGDVLDDLNRRLQSPEMDKFLNAWGQSMPKIARDVGIALNALGEALTAFFVPILPYAERLAENFRLLMERFSAWAKSAQGQNSIANYMRNAWENAVQLWELLGNLTKVIGTLFTEGARAAVGFNSSMGEQRVMLGQIKSDWEVFGGTGEGVMQKINRKLEEFDTWLNTKEGRESLRQWFEDAEKFMGDVWEILGELGEAFDELDSPEGRKSLREILDLVESLAGLASSVSSFTDEMSRLLDQLNEPFNFDLWESLFGEEKMAEFRTKVQKIGSDIWDWIKLGLFSGPDGAGEIGQAIWDGIWEGLTTANTPIGKWVDEHIIQPVKDFLGISSPSTVFIEIGKDIVAGLIEGLVSLPGKIVEKFEDAFSGVPGYISGKLGEAKTNIDSWVTETGGKVRTWVSERKSDFQGWASDTGGKIRTWVGERKSDFQGWASETGGKVRTWVGERKSDFQSWASETGGKVRTWVGERKSDFQGWASDTGGKVRTWVGERKGDFQSWASETGGKVRTWVSERKSDISSWATTTRGDFTTWKSNVGATLSTWKSDTESKFRTAMSNAKTEITSKTGAMETAARGLVSAMGRGLSGLYSTVTGKFSSALEAARGIASTIGGLISGAASRVSSWKPPWNASGNIYYGPTVIGVGEAGPEAIVPLNRPLSQVDPSVRALSAIAQGLAVPGVSTIDNGRAFSIAEGAITVMAPNSDPVRVAESVLDHIVEELSG